MYARVPDLYGIVGHEAFAAIAAAQNSGLFRYAGYWSLYRRRVRRGLREQAVA